MPNSALLATIEADNLVPSLQGAAVKIFGVARGGEEERTALSVPRPNKLLDFWNTLFERGGAAPFTISQTWWRIRKFRHLYIRHPSGANCFRHPDFRRGDGGKGVSSG